MSYSYTTTDTFTKSHARRLAAKVAADMHQCQLRYGHPTDSDIENYQQELAVLLLGGYVKSYEFGYKTTEGRRVLSWFYTPGPAGDLEGGRSGGLYMLADVSNAKSFNFLSYSSEWDALSTEEQDKIEASHPINRTTGSAPEDGDGYWDSSRLYVSGDVAVTRKEFRPWA
jgi:hypothetical protein